MSQASSDDEKSPPCRLSRRTFVIATSAGLSGGLLPGIASAAAGLAGEKSSAPPSVRVADLASLKVDVPVPFTYPDENSPAVLIRLRQPAQGGVGPDNSIVAYSQLCTHKGCPVAYRPERKLFICPCHWSSFDPAKAGQMVIGQGSHSLPRILLRVDGGAVHAVGVDGLIYGRHTNVL
jgi:arsenite oxidase small subunit